MSTPLPPPTTHRAPQSDPLCALCRAPMPDAVRIEGVDDAHCDSCERDAKWVRVATKHLSAARAA